MNDILVSNNSLLNSELQEDDVSLNCKFIICDFLKNGNNVMLNRKTIDTWIDTLISQPVVASITVNDDGSCDFSGHNVVKVNRVDENGNVYEDIKFDTSAIGVFNNVSIEIINGVEYIVATAKIWKRFTDFCALIKKRISEGAIATSWEIAVEKSHIELIDGKKVKVIDKGKFMGHALLNQFISPAYESSKMLVASKGNNDEELIEAIKRDFSISNITNKEENKEVTNLEDTKKEGIVEEISTETPVVAEEDISTTETVVENTPDTPVVAENIETKTETSALTEFDLRQALRQAIAEKLNVDRWDYYILYHFPADKVVWTQKWDAESELDVTMFTYEVENDIVTVSEPSEMKLTVSVAQINSTVAELNTKVDGLTNSLVEASTKIQSRTKDISELMPYKESFEQAEQARIEKETSIKRENLKKFAIDSKFISETELSSDESIKICIDNVDEKGLKAIIAERFVKSLDIKTENTNSKEVETSSITEPVETPKADITDSDIEVSSKNIMKQFLKR